MMKPVDTALVKNAADPKQVKNAGESEKRKEQDWENTVRAQMASPAGRAFVHGLLAHCRVWESIWHPSALIHYNAGLRDVGHWLMAEIQGVDRRAFLKMQEEALARLERDEAAKLAMHTQQASSRTGDNDDQA